MFLSFSRHTATSVHPSRLKLSSSLYRISVANFGKKLGKAKKQKEILPGQGVGPAQAIELIRNQAWARFNETVEASVNLALDPRKPNQSVRTIVSTPHSLGKTTNIAVFTTIEGAKEKIENLGVKNVGGNELISKIKNDELKLDFSHVFCTSEVYPELKKSVARKLGPKKLMPNKRLGTILDTVEEVAEKILEASKGTVELRNDRAGVVRFGFGKLSSSNEELFENLSSLLISIREARPESSKGKYMLGCSLSSTMGPGVKLNIKTCDPASKFFLENVEESEVEIEKLKMEKHKSKQETYRKTETKPNPWKNEDGTFKPRKAVLAEQ